MLWYLILYIHICSYLEECTYSSAQATITRYHRLGCLNNRTYFHMVLKAGGLRSEYQCGRVLVGELSTWLGEGLLLSMSSSNLICLLKTGSPDPGTLWGRASTYEGGDPIWSVAMQNSATVVIKAQLPCSCTDILMHDSEVEKYFRKIVFLQVTFYTVLSLNCAIPKSIEFGKAIFK